MTAGSTTGQTVTNPLGQTTSTTLDPLRGLPVTATDLNDITTTLVYDGLGRLTQVWADGRTPAPGVQPTDEYSYQVYNSVPSVVTREQLDEAGGYITSTTLYDALLRVRQTQQQAAQGVGAGTVVDDYFYDSRGWLEKTNANVWVTQATGCPTGTTLPGACLLTITDGQVADQTTTNFDSLSRPVLQTKWFNSTTSAGGTAAVAKSATVYAYYGDRVTTATFTPPACLDTSPPCASYTATAEGTPSSTVTDALGRQAELDSYTADPTISVSNASGVGITGGTTQATDYGYDTRGWLSTITDAATGEQWSKGYNLLGQVTSTTDPNSGTTHMAYDPAGNLIHTTDADGNTLTYAYDALDRKTGEYDGPTTSSPQLASWMYDNANNAVSGMPNPIGHLTTEISYSGGHAYTIQQAGFNAFGEPLGETETIPATGDTGDPLAGSYTLYHRYTPNVGLPEYDYYPCSAPTPPTTPNPASPSATCPTGAQPVLPAETIAHIFDYGTDLPSALDGFTTYVGQVAFTAQYQVSQQQIGGIVHGFVNNTYDPTTGALTDTQVTQPGPNATQVPVDDSQYGYNAAGQVTSQTDTRTLASATQAETQCFGYDSLGRLSQAWTTITTCGDNPTKPRKGTVGDGIPGSAYWTSWVFDPLGDQATQTQHSLSSGGSDTVTTYCDGGTGGTQPNTLTSAVTATSASSCTSGTTPTTTWTYDADGNTKTQSGGGGNESMTWSDDGKLASVTTNAGTTSYTYDADGNLLEQKTPTTDTLYLFGGAQQVSLDTATGTITGTRFIDLPGGGMVVRTGTGPSYYYALTDQQGTATLTLDSSLANPIWRQYTPYGAPRGQFPTTWPDPNGFLNDPTTTSGLTIIGARAYNPDTGRFLSVDPLLKPNDPQQLNGYTYAADDPTTDSDPTGLIRWCGPGCNPGPPPHQRTGTGGNTSSSTDGTGVTGGDDPGQYVLPEQDRAAYIIFMATWTDSNPYATGAVKVLDSIGVFCATEPGNCPAKMYGPAVTDRLWLAAAVMGGGFGLAGELGRDEGPRLGGVPDLAEREQPVAVRDLAQLACLGGQSFTAGTKVLLANGLAVLISRLRPGEKVLATNTRTGKTQAETITAVLVHHDTDLYDLTVKTAHGVAVIQTTANHFFWDPTARKWVRAAALRHGEHLRTTDGTPTVADGGTTPRDHANWMWDLTIPGNNDHDFYVLAASSTASGQAQVDTMSVLVHNADLPCNVPLSAPNNIPRLIRNAYEDIRLGNGVPHLDENGDQVIFQGYGRVNPMWRGSTEWEVPGAPSNYRILVNQYGQLGWTTNHYDTITPFGAPWYPDTGWGR